MSKKMKPEVICHIMGSVDGRLLPQRWSAPFGDAAPGELFSDYAAIGRELDADAWMSARPRRVKCFLKDMSQNPHALLSPDACIKDTATPEDCS